MATWRDLKPIFDARAAAKGWIACDQDVDPEHDLGEDFRPVRNDVFRALEQIAPGNVRYLILGQDPYVSYDPTGRPHATGVAFAVDERCKDVPKSLRRIMDKVYLDGHGSKDLQGWRAKRGVLLLNAALTVPKPPEGRNARDVAGQHLPFWKRFTASLVAQVRVANPEAKFVAWGADARNVISDALERSGVFVSAYHPTTYAGGDKSFEAFWETDIGRELRAG